MCRCQSAMAQSIETAAGVGRSCLVAAANPFDHVEDPTYSDTTIQ